MVCRHYGVDPAAFIEDPYLAWQLRLALFWANRPTDPETPDEQEQAMTDEMAALIE